MRKSITRRLERLERKNQEDIDTFTQSDRDRIGRGGEGLRDKGGENADHEPENRRADMEPSYRRG